MPFHLVLTRDAYSNSYALKFIIFCVPDKVHRVPLIIQYGSLLDLIDDVTFECKIGILSLSLSLSHLQAMKLTVIYEIRTEIRYLWRSDAVRNGFFQGRAFSRAKQNHVDFLEHNNNPCGTDGNNIDKKLGVH